MYNSIMTRNLQLSLFLLSAATLTFEINLTRLFSVSQFYHFAFMIVSIALLGFGASGTTLALFPKIGHKNASRSVSWLSLATSISILVAYLITNWLPFDSFSIAWDWRQVAVLVLNYIVLAAPFFFSGMTIGMLLTRYPRSAGHTYGVNLSGSAIGCLLALISPSIIGGEGTVLLSSALAAAAAFLCARNPGSEFRNNLWNWDCYRSCLPAVAVLAITLTGIGFMVSGFGSPNWLDINISPYKSLSYALQFPGAKTTSQRWNSFSRVDQVQSQGIRSLPGLSYRYLKPPPPQDGLFVDGDDLSPVLQSHLNSDVFAYLPAAIAFYLRPQGESLILGPRGGLDVLTAIEFDAGGIVAVEVNPLIVASADHIYKDPQVQTVLDTTRSYNKRAKEQFDLVLLSLTSAYHPVRSGAYSLAEDYTYTVESFQDAFNRLNSQGIFVSTRWLQNPPSEMLRTFALAVEALERSGINPVDKIVAFRGYNTGTLLVKKSSFTAGELNEIRNFLADRSFDLIYAPDIDPQEVNRFNILTEPIYYQTFQDLLAANPRSVFYNNYAYDIAPPEDDKPFFGHFFKWSQAKQVAAEFGKTWQPFGGAGYFVVLALLLLTSILAFILILLPIVIKRFHDTILIKAQMVNNNGDLHPGRTWKNNQMLIYLIYFGLLGFAFLLVEIPLIQGFILYLGHPAYALTSVLFTLLLFSGLGSWINNRIPASLALGILVVMLLLIPIIFPYITNSTLGFSLPVRVGLTIIMLAPIGFLMGIPFPAGITLVANMEKRSLTIPWIWGVNGSTSVVSSVLAALIALSFGFSWVFRIGALCYTCAWIAFMALNRRAYPSPPPR